MFYTSLIDVSFLIMIIQEWKHVGALKF